MTKSKEQIIQETVEKLVEDYNQTPEGDWRARIRIKDTFEEFIDQTCYGDYRLYIINLFYSKTKEHGREGPE